MEGERDILRIPIRKRDEELDFSKLLDDVIGGKVLWTPLQGKTIDKDSILSSCRMMEVSNSVSTNGGTSLAIQSPSISDRQREISILMLHWLYEMGMIESAKQLAQELTEKKFAGLKYTWMGTSMEKPFAEWVRHNTGMAIPNEDERTNFFFVV
jgi:hypothetical protein